MEALINAGGKGTRMGPCGIEKPMQIIGGKPVIQHVLNAVSTSKGIERTIVSVSSNTPVTKAYLRENGIETVETSGESFMDDLHTAFKVMNGRFVLTSPSDLPLLRNFTVDAFIDHFSECTMESAIAVVDETTVKETGIVPSYTIDIQGRRWVLSGLCIMDRVKTLEGVYLKESYFMTDWPDLAVNVNTQYELDLARGFYDH